ncbi:jerky protein homolog-like [Bombus pyrosoma]|uniref:jerky protein homolog-like n=1 Tax=Bombus pyrosoma TaxID=396416 RepID=UPI001CB8C215|nr:jerky protein homolog-like [Bombus pyrosoma]
MLTVAEKYEILQMIEKGESNKNVAEKFGTRLYNIRRIKARKQEITKYFKASTEPDSRSAIIINSPYIYKDLNKLLRQWYIRCTVKDIKLTGPMICEKAQELNKQLKDTTFKASPRWVSKFRQRHSLRKADIGKDLETPNQAEADIFKAEFHEHIQKEGYRLENVYNVETTGLLWKAVPETTLLSQKLKSLGRKKGKGQITIFLCANATGCHKLPVLTVCMIKDPPSIKCSSARVLSIMHKTNAKPYMDSNIFNEWFNQCFLKSVTERQQKNGQRRLCCY